MRFKLLAARVGSWPGFRRLLRSGAGPQGKCRWCRLPEAWHRNERGRVIGCQHARQSARVPLTGPGERARRSGGEGSRESAGVDPIAIHVAYDSIFSGVTPAQRRRDIAQVIADGIRQQGPVR